MPGEEMTGTVRITCPQGLADTVIVPIVARFLSLHPAIAYDLVATDQHLDLRHAGVDPALRFGWARDGDCVAKRLVTHREVLCASPQYLSLHGVSRARSPAHAAWFACPRRARGTSTRSGRVRCRAAGPRSGTSARSSL